MDRDPNTTKILAERFGPSGPGAAYVVTRANGTVFDGAAGLADISGGLPMDPATTMAAFSMTKTLTAIAVLQLAEAGALRLDDEVRDFIGHPYDPAVTVRQLVTHTAGIPNPMPLRWVHPADAHDRFDEPAALAKVLAKHGGRTSPPGRRYRYSNIGYWLLGRVIEAAAKQRYVSYMRDCVLEPLGLGARDLDFAVAAPQNHAKGYLAAFSLMNALKGLLLDRGVWGGYEGRWLRIREVYPDGPAFGGAVGSAAAFGAILRDLLKDDSTLLSKGSKALLFEQARLSSGRTIAMTLGWHVGALNGRPFYFKEGGGAGFHCEMRMYPDAGLASILMANRTSLNTNRLLSRLDRAFVLSR